MDRKFYAYLIAAFIIGGVVGYQVGYLAALDFMIDIALDMLTAQGYDVEGNVYDLMEWGLWSYRNQVTICFDDWKNASLYGDTGN